MHTTPWGSSPTVPEGAAELSAHALGGTAFSHSWFTTVAADLAIEGMAHLDEARGERDFSAEIGCASIRDLADVMVNHDADAMGRLAAGMLREEETQVMWGVEAHGVFLLKPSAGQATWTSDPPHSTIGGDPVGTRRGEAWSHAEA